MSEPFEAFGDVEDLAADLASPDATVRRLAVMALAETSDWQAVPHLVAAIADAAPEVREQAARALGEFDGRAVGEALARAVTDSVAAVAAAAAESLAELRDADAGGALLALVASLFLLRGIAWWTDNSTLDRISLIPAALIPLGALIVTEGLLRRHAHRRLKVAALVGGGVLALAGALGPVELENVHTAMLSAFQLAGFAVCAVLLIGRGRADLLAWENRAIDRVAFGAVLVIPFIITDFRVLAPDMPVRLGALGALLAVTAILIAGANDETQRQGVLLTVLRIVGAALLGAAAAALSADVDAAQLMRHCAV
ncbi:MAG: HEAT repeat domain-containing protein, partial [Bradyrhizobium sp.]|nr:HEAT repeat domain-containing protein [Bradyrhizobium sp.]